jgi:hypothetical protein
MSVSPASLVPARGDQLAEPLGLHRAVDLRVDEQRRRRDAQPVPESPQLRNRPHRGGVEEPRRTGLRRASRPPAGVRRPQACQARIQRTGCREARVPSLALTLILSVSVSHEDGESPGWAILPLGDVLIHLLKRLGCLMRAVHVNHLAVFDHAPVEITLDAVRLALRIPRRDLRGVMVG